MILSFWQKNRYELCVLAMLAPLACFLVLHPAEASAAAVSGIALCLKTVVPSLFPFFVLSSLLVSSGVCSRAQRLLSPVMEPLFHVSGRCAPALLLGLVGGYPVGAQTVASLLRAGQCSREESGRLMAFCSNGGPAFILSVAGAGVFGSAAAGGILLLAHGLAALLTGLLLCRKGRVRGASAPAGPAAPPPPPLPVLFTRAVSSSFSSVLNVCGFIIFFSVLSCWLETAGLFPLLAGAARHIPDGPALVRAAAAGLLEMTGGVAALSGVPVSPAALALASFLMGFGGLSVHCQVLSAVAGSGADLHLYLPGKLLQGVLAAGLTLPLFPLLF